MELRRGCSVIKGKSKGNQSYLKRIATWSNEDNFQKFYNQKWFYNQAEKFYNQAEALMHLRKPSSSKLSFLIVVHSLTIMCIDSFDTIIIIIIVLYCLSRS